MPTTYVPSRSRGSCSHLAPDVLRVDDHAVHVEDGMERGTGTHADRFEGARTLPSDDERDVAMTGTHRGRLG
jgi:hypothetical protein